jgi:hypothetical protein
MLGQSWPVIVYDGQLRVHYGQAYVMSGDAEHPGAELPACFRGQSNGLVGAAFDGVLVLITGLHTGEVNLRIEVDDDEPPLDPAWEEVVEVSFTARRGDTELRDWDGVTTSQIPLEAESYRVRYSGAGMDAAQRADTLIPGQLPIDSYSLCFWPAPSRPDEVVKQTSQLAAYWHSAWSEAP